MNDDLARTDEFPIASPPPNPLAGLVQPVSSRVRVDYGAVSDRGLVRTNNEDHYLIARVARSVQIRQSNLDLSPGGNEYEEAGWVLAVADGMGGHSSGEVASRMALLTGVHLVLNEVRWTLKIDEQEAARIKDRLGAYVLAVHHRISAQGDADPKLNGMGTTLTVAYCVGRDLFTAHVGDSRAYLYRQGRLEQITQDHTVAQRLVEEGILDLREAAHHRTKHILTNVVGGKGEHNLQVEVRQRRLQDGDRLLLCSDGLTDMVEDDRIGRVLETTLVSQKACDRLYQLAMDAGGRDNVTIALARFFIPAETAG